MLVKRVRTRDIKKNQAILKAATKLFIKNGYANTSMDAIAEMAGVTKQTIYGHYNSKDALFTQMVSALCVKHAPAQIKPIDSNISAQESLNKIGVAFLDMFINKDVLSATRLVVAEAISHPKLAKNYYESGTLKIIAMLQEFLDIEVKRGSLHINDTNSAASHLFAMLKGNYYIRMLLGVPPIPTHNEKEAHVKEAVEMFLRIYR
jgi:TetR/AcrR family transcriptional regulator, mexJK operon transcriptional repressor